jgi:hypothetical protein
VYGPLISFRELESSASLISDEEKTNNEGYVPDDVPRSTFDPVPTLLPCKHPSHLALAFPVSTPSIPTTTILRITPTARTLARALPLSSSRSFAMSASYNSVQQPAEDKFKFSKEKPQWCTILDEVLETKENKEFLDASTSFVSFTLFPQPELELLYLLGWEIGCCISERVWLLIAVCVAVGSCREHRPRYGYRGGLPSSSISRPPRMGQGRARERYGAALDHD